MNTEDYTITIKKLSSPLRIEMTKKDTNGINTPVLSEDLIFLSNMLNKGIQSAKDNDRYFNNIHPQLDKKEK